MRRAALLLLILLAGCTSQRPGDPLDDLGTSRTASGPDGRTHVLSGRASWYGKRFHGRRTACGEPFDMNAFTAAHKTLPFHTLIRVTNTDTRQEVVVRVNDRGPYSKGRVVDLSRAAASDMGMIDLGTAPVTLEVLSWGDGSRCDR